MYIEAIDVDRDIVLEKGQASHRVYLPDPAWPMGWGPRPSRRDTLNHTLGQPIPFSDFTDNDNTDCLHEVNYHADGYFSLYSVNRSCIEDGLEKFVFDMKPTMQAQISISPSQSLRYVGFRVSLLDNVQPDSLISQSEIDAFGMGNDEVEDLSSLVYSVNLVKNARVIIRTTYRFTGVDGTFRKDTTINTSMSDNIFINMILD